MTTDTDQAIIWAERYAYLWVSSPYRGMVAEVWDYAHPDMAADYGPVDPPYGWAVYPTGGGAHENPAPVAAGDARSLAAAQTAAENALRSPAGAEEMLAGTDQDKD